MTQTTGDIYRLLLPVFGILASEVTTNKLTLFTGRMPSFLSPTQQCYHQHSSVKVSKGKSIIVHSLAQHKLTWGLPTLTLTTKYTWLSIGEGFQGSRQPSDASTPL